MASAAVLRPGKSAFFVAEQFGFDQLGRDRAAIERDIGFGCAGAEGMNGAGNPSRLLVVAPLVKGKTTFDPAVLGGKAVVLRVDNSVQSFPIGKDGRVMIDGLDLFDPAQPFWDGKVPPVLWPKD